MEDDHRAAVAWLERQPIDFMSAQRQYALNGCRDNLVQTTFFTFKLDHEAYNDIVSCHYCRYAFNDGNLIVIEAREHDE